jgi:hypothetical protein
MTLHLNVFDCRLDSTHVNMVMSHWPPTSNGKCILGPRFPSSWLSLWFEELLHMDIIGVQNPCGEFMGWRSPSWVIIVCILKLLPLIEMCRGFDGSIIYLFIYVIIKEVQSLVHRANCLKQALAYTDAEKYGATLSFLFSFLFFFLVWQFNPGVEMEKCCGLTNPETNENCGKLFLANYIPSVPVRAGPNLELVWRCEEALQWWFLRASPSWLNICSSYSGVWHVTKM